MKLDKSTVLILVFAVITFGVRLYAQEQQPTVGLVLSGGGAKGLAHVGVLKVLEDVGIVPDYITGTSMGAIVGGLYAVGYSADELEEIALAMDWDAVLTNKTRLSNIAIEEKPYYGRYQVELPITKWSIGLPRGLIEGQELSMVLNRLTAPVHHVHNFDSLPRPFRCIGADIETGRPVVLKEGFLPRAIRASMAIPTIFTPVEIDDKLLVDGGIVHNFPVREVIEMGADIVIGVVVSDSLVKADELNSLVDILNQSMFIMSINNTLDQIPMVDYFMHPDMYPYTAGSFNDADSIIGRGLQEGMRHFEVLKDLADSLKALRTFEPIVRPPIDSASVIESVLVRGNTSIPSDLILGKMRVKKGDTLIIGNIQDRIEAIYGTRYFDRITYALLPDGNEETRLEINVAEASPGRASFNLHYDTENSVGLMTNLTLRNFGLPNSRLLLEADIADVFYFKGEYFVYTGIEQNLGIAMGANYYSDDLPVFSEEGDRTVIFRSKLWNYYLDMQSTHHRNWSVGLRLFSDHNVITPEVGDTTIRFVEKLRYWNIGLKPFAVLDDIDFRDFPTNGTRLTAGLTLLLNMQSEILEADQQLPPMDFDRSLWSLDLSYEQYFALRENLTLGTRHYLRLTNQEADQLNISDYHFVGGFKPNFQHTNIFWGGEKYEYQLTSYYLGALLLRYEPWRNVHFTLGANYLETQYPAEWLGEDYFESLPAGAEDRRFGILVEAAIKTRLGPVRLALTDDFARNKVAVFFSVGYNFRNFREP